MGEQWMDMVPMIAALFSLSLGSSLLSLLGLWAPTADVSVLLGWALIVFMLITYYKIKTNGFLGYLKGFCDPVFPMAPFNVLGEVFKPISMSFRHFGNVLSGYVISSLVYAALILANHALFGLLPVWSAMCSGTSHSWPSACRRCSRCISTGSPVLCRRLFSAC